MIHMPQNFDALIYKIGSAEIVSHMPNVPVMQPFSDRTILFLSDLSKKLKESAKGYPDVLTFAFWIRKAALELEKSKYPEIRYRLGKGVVFHSTPSNIPINFAYSFAAGLLAGNANIVRLPGRNFPQTEIICAALNDVLSEQSEMVPYVAMIKYDSSKDISDFFSSISDIRMVWGGNQTVMNMRESAMSVRSSEITFADRFSILVLGTTAVLDANDYEMGKLARQFYNDTYLSDQNACTSPHLIIWLGSHKEEAKNRFWSEIGKLEPNYNMAAVQAIGKLAALYRASVYRSIHFINSGSNFIYRIKVDSIDEKLFDFKYNSGFFFEYDASQLDDIVPVCKNKCQTLTYFGIANDKVLDLIVSYGLRGIDRIMPVGKSMDFSLVWDGHDLIRELSRIIIV